MDELELWAVECTWKGKPLPYESFTLIICDDEYYALPSPERPGKSPKFESFVATSPHEGKVMSGNVLQWNTVANQDWRMRRLWSRSADQRIARQMLENSLWAGLFDLNARSPLPPGATSRRQHAAQHSRKGDATPSLVMCTQRIRMDTYLPAGIRNFLASCLPRPNNIEDLCRTL
jgi:hypothetical protein